MQMELTPIRRFECMSRSRSSALPTVTEHRFLEHTGEWEGAGHRACAAREPEMRSHSDTVLFLFAVSRPLPLLVLLKTSGKGNSPWSRKEMERVDHGLLLGDHLKAGRGYLPGCRSSAWGHAAFRDTLSHTRLASYQGTGLCVWHPLGYCNTA